MASKFADFVAQNQLDPRRILTSSRALEKLRPEDRARRLAMRKKSGEDKSEEDDKTEAAAKPRSGRPVTPRLLGRATAGDTISGPAKTRLLRAVNRLLEQKKKEPVELRTLF